MGLVTKIEEVIAKPFELFHSRNGFQPVDVCRLALKCLENGVKKGINKTYAPNLFRVRLNKADYKEYKPFINVIRSDIKGELRRVIEERNYLLAGSLDVEIVKDPALLSGLPRVEGFMQGEDDPRSVIVAEPGKKQDSPIVKEAKKDAGALQDDKTIIMLPGHLEQEHHVSVIHDIKATFDTELAGVHLHIGSDGVFIENRHLDKRAQINKKVVMESVVEDGDILNINGIQFIYRTQNDN
ncbi:MAG: FhaA domain-containing protein [Pseudomonadota bacterium]